MVKNNDVVLSPGMKYRHYAPNSRCLLIYSDKNNSMVNKVKEISKEYKNPVIICSEENTKLYNNAKTLSYGSKENYEEIASNIFRLLREVDKLNPDIVLIEGIKKQGIGIAIMNRLNKSAGFDITNV